MVDVVKLTVLQAGRVRASNFKDGVDPEALTHYFGNDEYPNGNMVEPMESFEPLEALGFSANGNEDIRELDKDSDLSEVTIQK